MNHPNPAPPHPVTSEPVNQLNQTNHMVHPSQAPSGFIPPQRDLRIILIVYHTLIPLAKIFQVHNHLEHCNHILPRLSLKLHRLLTFLRHHFLKLDHHRILKFKARILKFKTCIRILNHIHQLSSHSQDQPGSYHPSHPTVLYSQAPGLFPQGHPNPSYSQAPALYPQGHPTPSYSQASALYPPGQNLHYQAQGLYHQTGSGTGSMCLPNYHHGRSISHAGNQFGNSHNHNYHDHHSPLNNCQSTPPFPQSQSRYPYPQDPVSLHSQANTISPHAYHHSPMNVNLPVTPHVVFSNGTSVTGIVAPTSNILTAIDLVTSDASVTAIEIQSRQ